MSQKSNRVRYGVYWCTFVCAFALSLFAIVVLTTLQHTRAAANTRASIANNAGTTELAVQGNMPSLDGAVAWINSQPIKAADLRGKVVLIEFWTYTCINWRRQFPYVRAWAEKYKDKGLVVIGVHTPEFVFEKNIANVRRLTKEIGVPFPVAVDSDYSVWRAFNNEYWPALYFVDVKGRIRHQKFGEGEYEESEQVIKQLLTESGASGIDDSLVSVNASGPEAEADWSDLHSAETYVGYEMAENFASPSGAVRDSPHAYNVPERIALNEWALSGNWTIKKDRSHSNAADAQLTFRSHARDLHLVMGPAVQGKAIKFRVLIDGHPPGAAHGTDVDEQGYGTLTEPRMYQLIRQPKPIRDTNFTISFLDPGAEAFCFTFG